MKIVSLFGIAATLIIASSMSYGAEKGRIYVTLKVGQTKVQTFPLWLPANMKVGTLRQMIADENKSPLESIKLTFLSRPCSDTDTMYDLASFNLAPPYKVPSYADLTVIAPTLKTIKIPDQATAGPAEVKTRAAAAPAAPVDELTLCRKRIAELEVENNRLEAKIAQFEAGYQP